MRKWIVVTVALLLAACSAASDDLLDDLPTEQPTQAPQTSAEEPANEPAPNPAPTVLPTAAYFINQVDDQVWRVEADGTTTSPITSEPTPIDEYSVSAERIAYVTANALWVANIDGSDPVQIAAGAPDEQDFAQRISGTAWSPDGSRLVYGFGGINIFDAATQESMLIIENDPVPDLDSAEFPDPPPRFYNPISWSPDGDLLLINQAIYFSDGIGVAVYDPASGAITEITSPDGIVCCNPTWTPDTAAIFTSNDTAGFISPGMWRHDVATGEGVTIIAGTPTDGEIFQLVSFARMLNNGRVFFFYGTNDGFPETQTRLVMTNSAADGSDQVIMRDDSHIPGDALWDPTGRGALIVDLAAQYEGGNFPNFPYRGPLVWLPADGSPAVPLGIDGAELQWAVN